MTTTSGDKYTSSLAMATTSSLTAATTSDALIRHC
jgi:hypothetical protein